MCVISSIKVWNFTLEGVILHINVCNFVKKSVKCMVLKRCNCWTNCKGNLACKNQKFQIKSLTFIYACGNILGLYMKTIQYTYSTIIKMKHLLSFINKWKMLNNIKRSIAESFNQPMTKSNSILCQLRARPWAGILGQALFMSYIPAGCR